MALQQTRIINCTTGATMLVDIVPEAIAVRRAKTAEAVDYIWAEKTYAGFTYDFGGTIGKRTLQTRQEDQVRWLALKDACDDAIAAGGGGAPFSIGLRDADNNVTTPTINQIVSALRAMRTSQLAIMAASWAIKDAVLAAKDHKALDAIDVESLWPK